MNTTDRILYLISCKGITGCALSKACQLNNSAISEWKKGKAQPSADALVRIADYFDVSVDYLLGRTDELSLTKKPDKQATASSSSMTKTEYLKLLVRSDEFNSLSLKARLVHFYCVINSDGRFILDLRLTQKAIGATEKDIQQLIESEYIVEEVPYVWAINAEVK